MTCRCLTVFLTLLLSSGVVFGQGATHLMSGYSECRNGNEKEIEKEMGDPLFLSYSFYPLTGQKDAEILASTVNFYAPKLARVPYPTIGGIRFVLDQIAVRALSRAKGLLEDVFRRKGILAFQSSEHCRHRLQYQTS